MSIPSKISLIVEAGHMGARADSWLIGAIACSVLGPFAAAISLRYFGMGTVAVLVIALTCIAVGCLVMHRRTRCAADSLYNRSRLVGTA